MDYQLKRQLRIEHYEALALKEREKVATLMQRSYEISRLTYKKYARGNLYFLSRSKRIPYQDINDILNQRDHAILLADRYSYLAEFARTDTTIHRDDPDALKKLQARLAKLERRKQKAKEEIRELKSQGLSIDLYRDPAGFNRAIRRVKERIYKVEQYQKSNVCFCIAKNRQSHESSERMVV